MDIFEQLQGWVAEQLGTVIVDGCGRENGAVGLFSQGVKVLRSWEDVTGIQKRQVRYQFLLRIIGPPGAPMADLLLRLQQQAAQMGISATDGTLRKPGSDGLGIYEIRLCAEREEIL